MSKKTDTIPTTQLEVVPRHELTKQNAKLLETTGAKLGVSELHYFLARMDAAKKLFGATAVAFGIELLRKKAATEHGKFQDVLAALVKSEAHSDLTSEERDNAGRQFRMYMQLGKSFLIALESGDGRFAACKGGKPSIPPHIQGGEAVVEYLLTLPREKLLEAIESFVAGKSIRHLLAEFREAAKAAFLEELTEEDKTKTKLLGMEKVEAQRKQAEQLYFAEFMPKITECFLCPKPTFEHLPKAKRQELAAKLHAAFVLVKKSLAESTSDN